MTDYRILLGVYFQLFTNFAMSKPEPCLCKDEEFGVVLLCSPSRFEDVGLYPQIILYWLETTPNSYGATQSGEVPRI